MINDILTLLSERSDFFIKLSIEHLMISIISIIIAIVLGGIIGIIVSEFHNSSKPILGTINFLYTIPSISMLGFLIPFSGIEILLLLLHLPFMHYCQWLEIHILELLMWIKIFLKQLGEWEVQIFRYCIK